MNENVLISGGTGLVGKAIIQNLEAAGYQVAVLSRNQGLKDLKSFYWDYENGKLEEAAIDFADIIIHLAGENISNKRWSKHQKEKIIDSRVKTTDLLFNALQKKPKKLKAFISASAIGYYGSYTSEKIFQEEDGAGDDFLAETVRQWEASVQQIAQLNIPTAILRLGVVMSDKGGALTKMLKPVEMGFGASLGSGKQWVPWIELNDLARLFYFVLHHKLMNQTPSKALIYNAVSPNYISNAQLMKSLAKAKRKPFFMPAVPAFMLKLIFGEMSTILLEGSRVSSERILGEGFEFNTTEIAELITKKDTQA